MKLVKFRSSGNVFHDFLSVFLRNLITDDSLCSHVTSVDSPFAKQEVAEGHPAHHSEQVPHIKVNSDEDQDKR